MPDDSGKSYRLIREHLAHRLEQRATELTRKWLDELRARLPEHPQRIFPDNTLLNHIPDLLGSMFSALRGGDEIDSDFVRQELENIGTLRRSQGYDLDEVLAELEILRGIVYEALFEEALDFPESVKAVDPLHVAIDLEKLLGDMSQVTSRIYRNRERASRQKRGQLLLDYGRAVTHELRNRLNAARLTLRVYRESKNEVNGDELLDSLERTLVRMERVAYDAFTVAMAQSHHATSGGDMTPFNALVEDVVRDLGGLAEEQGVELRSDPDLPHFPVDSTRVSLVLMNLLTNAIKYSDPTRDPGCWVEIRAVRQTEARTWRIDVNDNGLGIPSSLQESIFDEYVRGPQSEDTDGEGLGLALSRLAVEQLDGRLWLTSELGHGSCFSFTLEEPSEDLDV